MRTRECTCLDVSCSQQQGPGVKWAFSGVVTGVDGTRERLACSQERLSADKHPRVPLSLQGASGAQVATLALPPRLSERTVGRAPGCAPGTPPLRAAPQHPMGPRPALAFPGSDSLLAPSSEGLRSPAAPCSWRTLT